MNRFRPRGLRGALISFGYAFRGIAVLLARQPHARVHAAAACATIFAGFLFGITRGEWIAIVLCIGLVFASEALNSAVEELADALHPDAHPGIGRAKDLAAAGVLISAACAAIVGLVIFLPRLIQLD
jgi:diacylglycerol kinase